MHSRMRHRVSEFQKVLNRAKTEVAVVDRKTARCAFPQLRSEHLSLTLSLQWPINDLALSAGAGVGLDDDKLCCMFKRILIAESNHAPLYFACGRSQ